MGSLCNPAASSRCNSTVGAGHANFDLSAAVCQAAAAEARVEEFNGDARSAKAETVLLVEDDSGVLALTSEMLQ